MPKFRKKPIVIDAEQWFKNGDHSQDGADGEGKLVRYFRSPDVPGGNLCNYCQKTMRHHGWIDTLEGGHIVCSGDWIIKGVVGEFYPCKPDVFSQSYEPVGETKTGL
jgi:hypothetical protein